MKSMEQMQSEMISKARFDGGYPRAVIFLPGIIALAENEEEFVKMNRQSDIEHLVFGAVLIVLTIALIVGAVMHGVTSWW